MSTQSKHVENFKGLSCISPESTSLRRCGCGSFTALCLTDDVEQFVLCFAVELFFAAKKRGLDTIGTKNYV